HEFTRPHVTKQLFLSPLDGSITIAIKHYVFEFMKNNKSHSQAGEVISHLVLRVIESVSVAIRPRQIRRPRGAVGIRGCYQSPRCGKTLFVRALHFRKTLIYS